MQAGGLLAPLAAAITAQDAGVLAFPRGRDHVAGVRPGEGGGPAKFWLWVFIGPDTVCFVMEPTRSGAVLARHAGIDEKTGQLLTDADGGPRRLVITSDFYAVYQSAGKKADGLVNLYCSGSYPQVLRPGRDANPAQLKYWTQNWLARFRDLYKAHDELTAAWQENTVPPAPQKKPAAARVEKATGLGRLRSP